MTIHDVLQNSQNMPREELEMIIEKYMKIQDLADDAPFMFRKFFDYSSIEMQDEKIRVLTELKNGKILYAIPDFENAFEKLPHAAPNKRVKWELW